MEAKITVIKYGTAVLTTQDFSGNDLIDTNIIAQHGSIINKYSGKTLIVSSGAVGIGKALTQGKKVKAQSPTTVKRLLAEVGQPYLVEAWKQNLPQKVVLQKLVTYADLERKTSTNTIRAALSNDFLYILNFNDGVDDTELEEDKNHSFGDNDHLAAVVAITCAPLAQSNRLIFNTSSDGFIDYDTQKTVPHLDVSKLSDDFIKYHCKNTSAGGTGGMATKLMNIRKAINSGVDEAWIINGKKPEQLKQILDNEHAGTKITKT